MSHEIQTPINAMLAFTEASRRGMYDAPAQQTEYLDQPLILESTIIYVYIFDQETLFQLPLIGCNLHIQDERCNSTKGC